MDAGKVSGFLLEDGTQMGPVRFQHVAPQDEPGEFPGSRNFNESGGFQFFQMVGKRRRRYRLALSHVRAGHAGRIRAQLHQNVVPARIRERLRDQADLVLRQFCRFRGQGGFSVSCARRCDATFGIYVGFRLRPMG